MIEKNRSAQHRGDDIQQNRILLLRNLRPKYFTAADGATLQTTVREWFRPGDDPDGGGPLSEERELVDWEYTVDGGTHHLWIWYAE